ncbi:hypothetical protein Nepgr_013519 [Nepenthes gracilis]|uniref:Uncharacterized protein n=1 Tax=Nepenthes gracilis TaxID=150966 RepID=A0AAD3SI47_NEPGR|nr:hypothetical protein Nepgr_013519 [Nepenthes gracilis]
MCVEVDRGVPLPPKIRLLTGAAELALSVEVEIIYHSKPARSSSGILNNQKHVPMARDSGVERMYDAVLHHKAVEFVLPVYHIAFVILPMVALFLLLSHGIERGDLNSLPESERGLPKLWMLLSCIAVGWVKLLICSPYTIFGVIASFVRSWNCAAVLDSDSMLVEYHCQELMKGQRSMVLCINHPLPLRE